MDGTGVLFRPLVDTLGDSRPVHVLRYPSDEVLDYDALLPRVLDALPEDGEFVLVAESFSGPLALRIAAERPRGLVAVVLCASFAVCPVRFPLSKLGWLVPLIPFSVVPTSLQMWFMAGGFVTPELRDMFNTARAQVKSTVLVARIREVLAVDVRQELAHCPYPVLYLRGTRDRVVASRNARQIQAVNPVVEVEDIEAPHLLLQAAPTSAVEAIDAFLAPWSPSAKA